jgi:hypothetical protein
MKKDPHDSVTKSEPGGPKNVGKSVSGRGEDVIKKDGKEPGRYEVGEKGADRPVDPPRPDERRPQEDPVRRD